MGWLSGWAKRRPITVDNTNIDADLTHFPLPVFLGTSVGQNGDDVSSIFDELGSSYLKLAVTDDDGTTQLYVEVEKWDATSEEAVLWVSSSGLTITASSAKTLYIYYDSGNSDNTSYVGDAGNRSEVWDSEHRFVYHLAGSSAKDSTANGHDGSLGGSPTTGVDGKLGYCFSFDGNDDYIDTLLGDTFSGNSKRRISFWYKATSGDWAFGCRAPNFEWGNLDGTWQGYTGTANVDTGIDVNDGYWHFLEIVLDQSSGTHALRIDGVEEASGGTDLSDLGPDIYIACRNNSGSADSFITGSMDEIRYETSSRTAAWYKADYTAQIDNILTFDPEEFGGSISGTVKEEGTGVSRTVRLYLRSTGELVGETTSASDGTFSISAAQDEHYVVALDDTSDSTDYNAQIYDRVTGV